MTHTYGLIGYPLSNTFSRKFFNDYFAEEKLDATHQYLNFEMKSVTEYNDLKDRYPNLRGCNVTIPHKQTIMPLLTRLDGAAKRIGAVNCVKIEADGTSTGYNTDYIGFRNDLLEKLEAADWTQKAFGLESNGANLLVALKKANALVLGTGGASLGVVEALRSLGVHVSLASRTAGEGKMAYSELMEPHVRKNLLIINTTPLGMAPRIETLPDIPYDGITGQHFCYDVVYNPAETAFLRTAKSRGAGVANGIGMLHKQAMVGWEIWNSETPAEQ
ncbi:shikimate dehydrogenase family protein [Neolewinella antarctica]|uniref:Shikimate dehydrogenase n=1 Tax=Neolewinella antarctica TaxID=442734 RepID=A0ABX0XCE2_9BACT|nr:shikimate dehydrogenase [Neolewinella antarctica]NJC26925.1 shikimate dehydrogenase [Neolewinella antarctica]